MKKWVYDIEKNNTLYGIKSFGFKDWIDYYPKLQVKEEPMLMSLNEIYEANGNKFPFTATWKQENVDVVITDFNISRESFVFIYKKSGRSGIFSMLNAKTFTWTKDEKKSILLEVGKKYRTRDGKECIITREQPTIGPRGKQFGGTIIGDITWGYDHDGIWSRRDIDPKHPDAHYDLIEEIVEGIQETLPVVIEQKYVLTPEQEKKIKEQALIAQTLCVETSIRIALFTATSKKVLEKDVETVINRIHKNKKKEQFTQKQLTKEIEKAVNTLYAE